MSIPTANLKLAQWYKNTIITTCGRAKSADQKPQRHSFHRKNLIIPVLSFLFTFSYVIGGFDYLLCLLVGWFISGCVSIPLILVIGGNYNNDDSKSDSEIHKSRLNLFQDICMAWTNTDEFNLVRVGLFIHSLINMFTLSLFSTMMQKSIGHTLYTFATIGIEPPVESVGEASNNITGLPSKQDVFNTYWQHKNDKNLSVDESYKLIEQWLTKDLGLTQNEIKEAYNFNLSRESFPRLARNHMPY